MRSPRRQLASSKLHSFEECRPWLGIGHDRKSRNARPLSGRVLPTYEFKSFECALNIATRKRSKDLVFIWRYTRLVREGDF